VIEDGLSNSLVVLGASDRIAEVLSQSGRVIVHVVKPGTHVERRAGPRSRVLSHDYEHEDFIDFATRVLPAFNPRAVVSVTESGALPAARANEALGLPGVGSEVVERFRNKALMRELLSSSGTGRLSPQWCEAETGYDAACHAQRWRSKWVIVKPVGGTASAGVRLVSRDELARMPSMAGMLVEEFIPGVEFSAETFTVNGFHKVIAVTEKETNSAFIELGHVIPPRSLSPQQNNIVDRDICAFLDAMGLENGPAHTEFKFGLLGLMIIESHTRIGGDGISELVHLVTGVDITLWSLLWPIQAEAIGDAVPVAPAAAVAFSTAAAGRVTGIQIPTGMHLNDASLVSLWPLVRVGDIVKPLGSSRERVVRAITTGGTPESAILAAHLVADATVIATYEADDK